MNQSPITARGLVSGRLVLPANELHLLELNAVEVVRREQTSEGDAWVWWRKRNTFTTQGLSAMLKSSFSGLTDDDISHIAVSSSTAAITTATTSLAGTTEVKVLGSQAEASQTASGTATFTGTTVQDIGTVALMRGTAASTISAGIDGAGSVIFKGSVLTSFSLDLSYEVTLANA